MTETQQQKVQTLEHTFRRFAEDKLRAGHGVMAVVGAMVAAAMALLRQHVGEGAPAKLLRGIADKLDTMPARKPN